MISSQRVEPKLDGVTPKAEPPVESAFAARRNAMKLSQLLRSGFIDLEHATNLLGDDHFIVDVTSTQQRTYVIGHWAFFFSLDLLDDRGRPPEVFLSLHSHHSGLEQGDPRVIARFFDFTSSECRVQVLDAESDSMRLRTIETETADAADYAVPAVAFIKDLLSTPAPVASKAFNLFGFFGRDTKVRGKIAAA